MIRYCLFILLIGFAACESRDIDKGDPATSDSAVSQLEPDGTEVDAKLHVTDRAYWLTDVRTP